MIRVETLRAASSWRWMIATLNGAWWSAVGAGRDWSRARQLAVRRGVFRRADVRCISRCSRRCRNRWIVRPLLTLLVVVVSGRGVLLHARRSRDPRSDDDPERAAHRLARGGRSAHLRTVRLGAWRWSALPRGVHLDGATRSAVPAARAFCCARGSVLGALVLGVLAILPISRDITSFMRNQREARYLITPSATTCTGWPSIPCTTRRTRTRRASRWARTRA